MNSIVRIDALTVDVEATATSDGRVQLELSSGRVKVRGQMSAHAADVLAKGLRDAAAAARANRLAKAVRP